ncbi:MAG: polyprenol monophosphomannose synthase [Candidatus Sumerlaeaceae bacterium]
MNTHPHAAYENTCVVLATYNEAPNLQKLVPQLLATLPGARVIVVDDNSPDGTPAMLAEIAKSQPNLLPLIREKKAGYGSAVLEGLKHGLELGADRIATLDADFSHDPAALPLLFEALNDADVAIGSRYFEGVRVLNWHPSRLLLSLFANIYVKTILNIPVEDATSGFRAYRRPAVEALSNARINSVGYSFLFEILFFLYRRGLRIVEVPIIYTERREGQSKMSGSVIREAVLRPWLLRLSRKQ